MYPYSTYVHIRGINSTGSPNLFLDTSQLKNSREHKGNSYLHLVYSYLLLEHYSTTKELYLSVILFL